MSNLAASRGQINGIPLIGTPLVEQNGDPSLPWYQFFINLLHLTGAGTGGTIANAVVLTQGANGQIQVVSVGTGQVLGNLALSDQPGLAPQALAVGPSPFEYTATGSSELAVGKIAAPLIPGLVEIGRAGVFTAINTTGACLLPMLKNDVLRLTYHAQAPSLTLLPSD